jgi:hypothetical protein
VWAERRARHQFRRAAGIRELARRARSIVVLPQPVPSISYVPPGGGVINPLGWVYQICPRASAIPVNQCPAGSPTTSYYGGIRLALQKGDQLKFRLVNRLPLIDAVTLTNITDGSNLPMNPTNIHTHGMVVQARAPTWSDPTFGDYIFVDIYNPANGIPTPDPSHQHGSVVMDYADYRIDVPANHPSGAFWFHPHVHGIAVNQVSGGMAGIISVGKVGDYASGDLSKAPFTEANVRHRASRTCRCSRPAPTCSPTASPPSQTGWCRTRKTPPSAPSFRRVSSRSAEARARAPTTAAAAATITPVERGSSPSAANSSRLSI